jgi:uncharacterized phage protein (TIGR01671 family)
MGAFEMREIEFRAWDLKACQWEPNLLIRADGAGLQDRFILYQYTGLKDANGVKIFEGDILNICFTSGSGEHIHDGIYTVGGSSLGALEFNYRGLFWESHGYNQYPISSTLCEKYGSLSTVYDNGRHLIKPDQYVSDVAKDRDFPFNNHKVLSFNSRYFKVIGNIYETPELLK